MKIAVSGKGGVGKTTLAAALSLLLARRGDRVLAVDADPDANLAGALGIPDDLIAALTPLAEQRKLVEERTGAKAGTFGQMFRLNPEVSDIADTYALEYNGVSLLVLGGSSIAGQGCACPENVLLRSLVTDLVIVRGETLVLDMEAGIEHLGRATARGVDIMLVATEPGRSSVESTRRILDMCRDLALPRTACVGSKITGPDDERYLRESLPDAEWLGSIPFSAAMRQSDRAGHSVLDTDDEELLEAFGNIMTALEGSP